MNKLTEGDINGIVGLYVSATITTESIATQYNVTPRTIQRIVKRHGVVRTIAEANRVASPLKDYSNLRKPDHLKAGRTKLSCKLRYKLLAEHPFCALCGNTATVCPLNIDHIDNDATNNELDNLQVLCSNCNQGKG